MKLACLVLFCSIMLQMQTLSRAANTQIFKDLEQLLLKYQVSDTGESFMAEEHMEDAAFVSEDSPKEIEIFCPGPDPPTVTVRELALGGGNGAVEDEGSLLSATCMTLKLTGANFRLDLSINCDVGEGGE